MNTIDWSEAPDWAKGHGLVVQGATKQVWYGEQAYMIVGDNRSYPYGGGDGETRHNHLPNAIQFKTLRPVPWTGEGLPPVGTVCECMLVGGKDEWVRCEIIAHKQNNAVCWVDCNRITASTGLRIRATRTPEQVEADEREKALKEMIYLVGGSSRRSAEALYDAGYRKQVQP